MSRPPRPAVADALPSELDRPGVPARYLPLEYFELLDLEKALAADLLGRHGEVEGDFAGTLMELSAIVAHVLTRYQNRLAREAYLDTAAAGSSLVRHAERLAYQPDLGLAATGYAVLEVKPGLAGTIDAGLGLASSPLGESRAQDYETTAALEVAAELNQLEPLDATRPVRMPPARSALTVEGIGHGLAVGDVVALVAPSLWQVLIVGDDVDEDQAARRSTIHFTTPIAALSLDDPAGPARLLAKPRLTLRAFGAAADPVLWPGAALAGATGTAANFGGASFQYTQATGTHDTAQIYLEGSPARSLAGEHLAAVTPATASLVRVDADADLAIALQRTETRSVDSFTVSTQTIGDTTTTTLVPATISQTTTTQLAATVRAVRLRTRDGTLRSRASFAVAARWLGGWSAELTPLVSEPNPAPLGDTADVPSRHSALAPGRVLLLSDAVGAVAQPVRIIAAEPSPLDPETATRIRWEALGPPPSGGWTKQSVRILANVAPISHGRTVDEILGGSDGVTPEQRFTLKQRPLTMLPSADGASPALEVRVDDVLWIRVDEFWESGPDDRHYRLAFDPEQACTIVFGDGVHGAVPASGRRNIVAHYRVGLGPEGDAAAGRIARLKTSHPLLAGAINRLPVAGGTAAASLEQVRLQGTRWIRSFGRAVSVADHADVALLFPGVAAANATWDAARGTVVTVATSSGETPPALPALRAFLDARRDASLPMVLQGPRPRALRVSVSIESDPAFLPDAVERTVRDALTGPAGLYAFSAGALGRSPQQSELLGALLALPGVLAGQVSRFRSLPASAGDIEAFDVIRLGADEWARLAPADLDLVPA